MLPGLGWSASDIVLAVRVITKVCIAFRDAGGAQEQYASTAAFLDAFARTLQRINAYAETVSLATDGKELSADMASQMKLVFAEYIKFDTYLKKVEPGLSSASFASRTVARARWATKEINAKVDALKKAVITPMMFITPLLAVETLSELREIKSRLPNATLQEDALRENRMMIVKINYDLANLKDNLESYWWTRRWAMTSVEEDIKALTLAIKNNSDIISNNTEDIENVITREGAKARQEQAAASLTTISTVETIVESRLAHLESRIDVMISEYREKTGKEDQELHSIKKRISNSRQHLHQAASAARKAIRHFGLLVMAVDRVHSNPVTKWILPLAGGIVGYDKIFEHGETMVKNAGQAVTSSGKYIEESDVMKNLKSWNPFTAAVSNEKARMRGAPGGTQPSPGRSPAPVSPTPVTPWVRSPILDCTITSTAMPYTLSFRNTSVDGEFDDFGDFQSAAPKTPKPLNTRTRTNTDESSWSVTTLTSNTTNDLLHDDPQVRIEAIKPTTTQRSPRTKQPQVSVTAMIYIEDNPWA